MAGGVGRRASTAAARLGVSAETRMPGLIVAETVIDRMYVPLAAAGLSDRR